LPCGSDADRGPRPSPPLRSPHPRCRLRLVRARDPLAQRAAPRALPGNGAGMTRFLRRLAFGMLHPDRAIHPGIGSMWSAPRDMAPVESSGEILVSPHPEDSLSPALMQTDRDTMMRGTAPRRRTERPSDPELNVPATFRPLVPLSPGDAFSAPRTLDPALHNEAFTPKLPAAPPETAIPQPVLRSESSRLPIPSTRIATPHPIAGREPVPFMRQAQPAQLPTSEHDAIEIHIGRIEVLAAPPPPPQPAPRPARKSLDLGEYLRRERRTR
jgi:hypothetical protein